MKYRMSQSKSAPHENYTYARISCLLLCFYCYHMNMNFTFDAPCMPLTGTQMNEIYQTL